MAKALSLKVLLRKRENVRKIIYTLMSEIPQADEDEKSKKVAFLRQKNNDLLALDNEVENAQAENEKISSEEMAEEAMACFRLQERLAALLTTTRLPPCEQDRSSCTSTKYKLPKLELERYDLNPSNWLSWWTQFRAIDEDAELEADTKFKYLKMTVLGRARDLVDSYPLSCANYPKVMDHLRSRFGKEDLILSSMYKELLNLVGCGLPLTELYDRLSCKIRSLESLGVDKAKTEILMPLIVDALPMETRRWWERVRSAGEGSKGLDDLLEFLRKEVETEERLQLSEPPMSPVATVATLVSTDKRPVRETKASPVLICVFCSKSHKNRDCNSKMSVEDRREVVKKNGLCFACLEANHTIRKCRTRVNCEDCKGRHYKMMCLGVRVNAAPGSSKSSEKALKEGKVSSSLFSGLHPSDNVVLQTLLARVGNRIVKVFVDGGSHRSYVSSRLVRQLKLRKLGEESLRHSLFGGHVTEEIKHGIYELGLQSMDGKDSFLFKGLEEKTLCSNINGPSANLKRMLAAQGIEIFDDDRNRPIDVLIGSDAIARLVLSMRVVDSVLVFETKLGWCVTGNQSKVTSSPNIVMSMCNHTLPSLWELEALGIDKPESLDASAQCIEHFERHVKREPDGRYSVKLPWVDDHPPLPTEYNLAEARLQHVVRRLERNNLYEAYDTVFREWEKEGIVEVVEPGNIVGHYLPHRPVIKEEKRTAIRPVFDASAKSVGKVSLNECLHKGPNLLKDLFSLLIRFRFGQVGLTADIRKAFLMISLSDETDRDMLRFLWWREGKLITLRHCRVVFGLSPSPFLLNATISHHLKSFNGDVAEQLKQSFYVDDCVTAVDSQSQAAEFQELSSKYLACAGFDLRGWVMTGDKGEQVVLGIKWFSEKDLIGCCQPKVEFDNVWTKRQLLSLVGRVYDPLGLLAAPVLYLKLVLQECFRMKFSWNDPLPKAMTKAIRLWLEDIALLPQVVVPRNIRGKCVGIHVFSDASKVAMGTCVFGRIVDDTGVHLQFITAKARVAPLSEMTIPRKELVAALMGARLGSTVARAIGVEDITYWSDSMVALHWIKKGEWKTFIGNRVEEIRQLSNREAWRFVPGPLNPADILSRSCLLSEYVNMKWLEGPSWLLGDPSEWPQFDIVDTEEALVESKVSQIPSIVNVNVSVDESKEPFSYYGSFSKNVRVMGWILRFLDKARKRSARSEFELDGQEMKIAELKLIRFIQDKHPLDVSKIESFVGEDGVIRIRTKILSEEFSPSFRQPALLPQCALVESLVRESHWRHYHVGTGTLLSILRESYWIVKGRSFIKRVLKSCIRCQRQRAKTVWTPPVGLPNNRVNLGKAFQVTGCDLAGPLYLRDGTKIYIVLFTCAVYRAVHLELVDSLSTEAFLLALRRMIARRGRIGTMYSDNGTNFVGAWNLIERVTVEREMKLSWVFNVPTASWWGGFWERLIGMIKNLLRTTLGRALLEFHELQTVVTEIEATVNSRPLTYHSDDPTEPRPLTPAMFLQDESDCATPDLDSVDQAALSKRLQYVGGVRQQLKLRFRREYLGKLLLGRGGKVNNVKVGDVVLMSSDQQKRAFWDLGRVTKTFPGKDGVVRVVQIKTAKGEFSRPVQRICPLELSGNEPSLASEREPPAPVPSVDEPVVMPEKRTRSGRLVRKPDMLNL